MNHFISCSFLFVILFFCFVQIDGGSYRSSFRSYRILSYRSYRSYRSSGSYRYTVNNALKIRYGGLSTTRKMYIYRYGGVYVPPFYRSQIRYDKDLNDDYAVCEGTLYAAPMNDTTGSPDVDDVKYSFFVCPSTYKGPDQYCCEAAPNQTCCTWDEFSFRYGLLDSNIGGTAGIIVGVITGLIVVGAIVLFGACRRHRAQQGRVVQPPPMVLSTPGIQNEYKAVSTTSGEAPVYPMGPQYPPTGIQYQSTGPSYPPSQFPYPPTAPENAPYPPNYETAMSYAPTPSQNTPYGGAGLPPR